jgi:hypothetical protein
MFGAGAEDGMKKGPALQPALLFPSALRFD